MPFEARMYLVGGRQLDSREHTRSINDGADQEKYTRNRGLKAKQIPGA
jgi:hypothetical protein